MRTATLATPCAQGAGPAPAGDDAGSAVVEFVLLAVVLLVPFTYAVLCVFAVERAAYAVTAAAREAGRAYARAPEGTDAARRAQQAADVVLADQGLRGSRAVRVTCDAARCPSPGARAEAVVTVDVPLPLVPRLPHSPGRGPASVRVSATHAELLDRYRAAGP